MLTMVYYPKGDPWGSRISIKKRHRNLSRFQLYLYQGNYLVEK